MKIYQAWKFLLVCFLVSFISFSTCMRNYNSTQEECKFQGIDRCFVVRLNEFCALAAESSLSRDTNQSENIAELPEHPVIASTLQLASETNEGHSYMHFSEVPLFNEIPSEPHSFCH